MKEPEKPSAEAERLGALRRAEILDTAPEGPFDELARLAKTVCRTPIALVTLVDERRAWFKARIGLDVNEVPRARSFCANVVAADNLVVAKDTLLDPRFADLPLVRSPPHIRFYAGAPVRTMDRHVIGTLCVLDVVPRELGDEQLTSLRDLAEQVAVQIQFRRWSVDIAASVKDAWVERIRLEIEGALLRGVLRAATEYSIIGTEPEGTITVFNEGAERMLGYRAAEVVGRVMPEIFHDREEVARRAAELGIAPGFEVFVAAARRGEAETREWTYVRKDGTRLPASLTVTAMRDAAGTLTGFIGIARDLTAERRAEGERARFLVERAAREAAERALDRLSRLHAVASALVDAVTPAQVVDVVVQRGMTALGACCGGVILLREDGVTLELAAGTAGRPGEACAPLSCLITDACPAAEAVRSGAPVFHETAAAAPIFLDDRPVGCVCLRFAEPRAVKEEDRIYLLALGRQCAQALERARLYEAEARARAEAEAANAAKDEFLCMLSHELRTPLAAVLGWVRILRTRPMDRARTNRALTVIERNAMAQLRLIEDILDISRMVTGKLVIAGRPSSFRRWCGTRSRRRGPRPRRPASPSRSRSSPR